MRWHLPAPFAKPRWRALLCSGPCSQSVQPAPFAKSRWRALLCSGSCSQSVQPAPFAKSRYRALLCVGSCSQSVQLAPFAKSRWRALLCSGSARIPFSSRHSQSRASALFGAARLPLLMEWRSLDSRIQRKIRASTIFRCIRLSAELLH